MNDKVNCYTVKAVYKFDNGMVMTFDFNGQQMPDLQGPYTKELEEKIRDNSGMATEWNGFGGTYKSGPINWNELKNQ